MKVLALSALALFASIFLVTTALGAGIAQTRVLERGPHHRVIETLGDDGKRIGSYTELETGMHRWDAINQQWVECEE